MKFKFTMKATDEKIPVGNRFMICSLIKNAVERGDQNLFKEIYLYGDKKNKKIKDFTFSIYLDNYKVQNDYVEVKGDISITISTTDYNLGIAIYNGIMMMKEYTYKNYHIRICKAYLLKEGKVEGKLIRCKTMSPIYIKNKNGKSIGVMEPEFEEMLNYISNIYLESFRGYGLKEKVKFTPVSMNKVVVKEEIAGFKEITGKSYIYIDSFKGLFNLEGDTEDLQILLKAGIGFRRSEGFGLIDLV